jgi:serine/threonine protein kinase
MEKLRTALGRFTSGLSNVDELRSVFRDYLREHPERRDTVAKWLAESIRIGRVSPALMLTIGDLLAPQKASAKPASKGSTSAVAGSMAVAGTSDFDLTVYPQPVARSPGAPAPPAPSEKPDPAAESRFDPVLSVPESPRRPQNEGYGGGAPNQGGDSRPARRPRNEGHGGGARNQGGESRPPRRSQNEGHGGGARNQGGDSRPIDPATPTEGSLVDLTNIGLTAEAMAADAEVAAKVGDVLDGRYTLVMEIGRGGMGTVFKALDRNREDFRARNPYIALKLLSDAFRQHPDAVMALQRETERAQSLAHENIVKVFDFDYDGPHAYMTMELLEGEPLEAWLRGPDFERATPERKWKMVEQIGEALVCAHKHGVVHSDLKPANIFVCTSGTVKVMDFGIARPLRAIGTESNITVFDPGKRLGGLTPGYASLEQWNQEAPDTRDDIYAFACLVYHIYGGKHPRGSIFSREDLENSPRPRRIRSLTHLQWDTLRRSLALRRRDRTASVQGFLLEFAPRSWLRRYRAAIVTIAAAGALALAYFGVRYYEDFAADQALNSQLWPSTDAPAKPLTPEQRSDIDDYLYLGQAALRQADNTRTADELAALLSKGDNNLLELLKRVRELDPANAQALKLTGDAASLFEDRAQALLTAGRPAEALRLVLEGQSFAHTYELFQLKRTLCRRNAELCRQAPPTG